MNESERNKKNERIAEIAKEILSQSGHIADYMGADVVETVDQARRAEHYERLGDRPSTLINTQSPPPAIRHEWCTSVFYRAGAMPAYLCNRPPDHSGLHSGDILAFPFRCHICSAEAPYRCLGCESNFCRKHMADHVLGTQELELERRLETALAAVEKETVGDYHARKQAEATH